MSNEAKNSILYNEPDITVEPHHLNDDEAALIAAYIKRLKQNNRRKALYAKKTQSVQKIH